MAAGEMNGDHAAMHAAMHDGVPMRANDAPRPSPNAHVMQTIGTTNVMVHYGRPAVKGRTIFASGEDALVPFGQVWRTGANEASTITFTEPVTVGGEPLAAGTYALFTIPDEDEWTVIFNRTAEQWGAFNYDDSQDVLRVTATPAMGNPVQEQFLITFENVTDTSADMVLAWDEVRVPVKISAAE